MEVSLVSEHDGKMCIQLLNLLKAGRWELSGPDIAAHADTVRWVQSLGAQMGEKMKASSSIPPAKEAASAVPAPESQSFKIKAMGPIGSVPKSARKKR